MGWLDGISSWFKGEVGELQLHPHQAVPAEPVPIRNSAISMSGVITGTTSVPAPVAPPAAVPAASTPSYGLANAGAFYDWLRGNSMLGPHIRMPEFQGTQAILEALTAASFRLSWAAYALATAYHETAHTMQPVIEAGWLGPVSRRAYYTRMYDIDGQNPDKARELGNTEPGDGAKYCGRGYVQETGKANYARAGQELGIDLVGHPELALDPRVAAQIMCRGMAQGWFTGRALRRFLPTQIKGTLAEFVECRTIINGHDKAELIAGYAMNWQNALIAGKYRYI